MKGLLNKSNTETLTEIWVTFNSSFFSNLGLSLYIYFPINNKTYPIFYDTKDPSIN